MNMNESNTKQQVYDAIATLCEENKIATRENIAQLTGLSLTIIDDRLKVLIDDMAIIRVQRGNFVIADQFPPPRVISKTISQNGIITLDIGDEVLKLTPREARNLGQLLMGDAFLYTLLGISTQLEQITGQFHQRLKQVEKKYIPLTKDNNTQETLF